jgi:hypothetical protein
MHRFTSRDLMVSVLPTSMGDAAECATACTNEPTRPCDNTKAPSGEQDWVGDAHLAILHGELADALA